MKPEAVRDRAQQARYRTEARKQDQPPPWVVRQRRMNRARGRAQTRLAAAHRDEYERLYAEEMQRWDS